MGKFWEKLEWEVFDEKNRKAGLKAPGKGGGPQMPKAAELLHSYKKDRGNKECYKSKVFFRTKT